MKDDTQISASRVYRSFFWKILERILSQGISLVVQIILARLLLPSDFGSLALIVAITNYAGIFVQSGIGTVVIQKENIDDKDIATLFTISLASALVLYIAIFAASPMVAEYYGIPVLKSALRVLALVLFLNAINAVQTGILSRKMKFKQIFYRSAIAVPIAGVVGISMAYLGFGIWALVAHNLVNMAAVVIFMSFDKDARITHLGVYKDRIRQLYSFSVKILLTSLVSGLSDTLRTMMIGKKYSSEDLAYYDKAYTYSFYAVSIINSSISTVLLPTFSRSQDNLEKMKEMARRSVRMSAFVMIPVMAGIASIARPIVLLVLSSKWAPCIPFLALFCILRIPGFIMTVDKQVYYAIGRSDINLFYEIGLCIVNVITLMITTQFGVFHIAIGATVVEYTGILAICIIASRTYGYSIVERIKDLWKPVVSSVVMVITVKTIGNLCTMPLFVNMMLQILSGAVIYLLSSIILKDQNLREIVIVISSLKHKSK